MSNWLEKLAGMMKVIPGILSTANKKVVPAAVAIVHKKYAPLKDILSQVRKLKVRGQTDKAVELANRHEKLIPLMRQYHKDLKAATELHQAQQVGIPGAAKLAKLPANTNTAAAGRANRAAKAKALQDAGSEAAMGARHYTERRGIYRKRIGDAQKRDKGYTGK